MNLNKLYYEIKLDLLDPVLFHQTVDKVSTVFNFIQICNIKYINLLHRGFTNDKRKKRSTK